MITRTGSLAKCLPRMDAKSIVFCTANLLSEKGDDTGAVAVVDAVPTARGFCKHGYSILSSPTLCITALEGKGGVHLDGGVASLSFTPANTVFHNGFTSTLLLHGQRVDGMHIHIPQRFRSELHLPLRAITEAKAITQVRGNIVSLLDGRPAAQVLIEGLDGQQNPGLVFAQVGERYVQVIAGGGEWSAKSGLLALADDFSPRAGDRMSFHLSVPGNRATEDKGIVFYNQGEALEEEKGDMQSEELAMFGAVTQRGFYVKDYWCRVPGAKLFMYE